MCLDLGQEIEHVCKAATFVSVAVLRAAFHFHRLQVCDWSPLSQSLHALAQ